MHAGFLSSHCRLLVGYHPKLSLSTQSSRHIKQTDDSRVIQGPEMNGALTYIHLGKDLLKTTTRLKRLGKYSLLFAVFYNSHTQSEIYDGTFGIGLPVCFP